MSTVRDVNDLVIRPGLREWFEEEIFGVRFIGSIQRTGKGGPFELVSVDCPTMKEFVKRNPEEPNNYLDEYLSAMWFGFRLGLIKAKEDEL